MGLRLLTAGESHGQALVTIIEGLPAGLPLQAEMINRDLRRRQEGVGRGGRMSIEKDEVQILSGVRHGLTLGSPIALLIPNRDWVRWAQAMSPEPVSSLTEVEIAGDERLHQVSAEVSTPRPGHADLAGAMKYRQRDIRNILERASARETATRVAAGAVAKALLSQAGIQVLAGVGSIGGVTAPEPSSWEDLVRAQESPVRSWACEAEMIAQIQRAGELGESLGGTVIAWARGVPPGLGSHVHWDRRLDGLLGQAILSIPAIKGFEIGLGFASAGLWGSQVHDPIGYGEEGFYRLSNRAGGIEGGMSNGEMIQIRAAMKPIPTLYNPLETVDLLSGESKKASVERSDRCAVPAAAVVVEAQMAWVLAQVLLEKFAGDHLGETLHGLEAYLSACRRGRPWEI